MHVSAASLAPDWPAGKATPSDNTERTARSGAVVATIFCQDHGVSRVGVCMASDILVIDYMSYLFNDKIGLDVLWAGQIYGPTGQSRQDAWTLSMFDSWCLPNTCYSFKCVNVRSEWTLQKVLSWISGNERPFVLLNGERQFLKFTLF